MNMCTGAVVTHLEALRDNCKDNSYMVLMCVSNRRVPNRKNNADQNSAIVTEGRTDGRKGDLSRKPLTRSVRCVVQCNFRQLSN